jgi:hypothetical protein
LTWGPFCSPPLEQRLRALLPLRAVGLGAPHRARITESGCHRASFVARANPPGMANDSIGLCSRRTIRRAAGGRNARTSRLAANTSGARSAITKIAQEEIATDAIRIRNAAIPSQIPAVVSLMAHVSTPGPCNHRRCRSRRAYRPIRGIACALGAWGNEISISLNAGTRTTAARSSTLERFW